MMVGHGAVAVIRGIMAIVGLGIAIAHDDIVELGGRRTMVEVMLVMNGFEMV